MKCLPFYMKVEKSSYFTVERTVCVKPETKDYKPNTDYWVHYLDNIYSPLETPFSSIN